MKFDSYFDAVDLDYKTPKKDRMDVSKEILAVNPYQRIILASAYIMEFLVDTVKQLKQVVELMQKPFEHTALVDTTTKSCKRLGETKCNYKTNKRH